MIKLFASDMDGTLLDETHTINERTANAIKDLQASGVEFMIATGRDYQSASRLLEAHQIQCAMINLNGALIHNSNGEVLYEAPLDSALIDTILTYLKKNDLHYSISTRDQLFLSNIEDYLQHAHTKMNERLATKDQLTLAQIKDHFSNTKDTREFDPMQAQVLKMMVISDDQDALQHCRYFLETFEDLDITSSGPGNLEITHRQAQKGLAIEQYIKNKGYSIDEVVTIGDSLNDRSMLQMCPNSYAMANASDEVKSMAAHLALANDQFGVAVVIQSVIDTNKPE